MRDETKGSAQQLADLTLTVTKLLDKLGLYTAEIYAQSREKIIKRQTQELLELSTPVVELWDKIVLLPLIGKRGPKLRSSAVALLCATEPIQKPVCAPPPIARKTGGFLTSPGSIPHQMILNSRKSVLWGPRNRRTHP